MRANLCPPGIRAVAGLRASAAPLWLDTVAVGAAASSVAMFTVLVAANATLGGVRAILCPPGIRAVAGLRASAASLWLDSVGPLPEAWTDPSNADAPLPLALLDNFKAEDFVS